MVKLTLFPLWIFVSFEILKKVKTSSENHLLRCRALANQSNPSILVTWPPKNDNERRQYVVWFWPLYSNISITKTTVNQSRYLATGLEYYTVYKFDIRDASSNSLICTARTTRGERREGLEIKRHNSTTVYAKWPQIKKPGFYTTYKAFLEWGSNNYLHVDLVYSGRKNYTWIKVKNSIPKNFSLHVNYMFIRSKEVSSTEFCRSDRGKVDDIMWPETKIGEVAKMPCPRGAYGNVTRKCRKGTGRNLAAWDEMDDTHCASEEIASIHDNLLRKYSNPIYNARLLARATAVNTRKYSHEDIKVVVRSLRILTSKKTIHKIKTARSHSEKDGNDLALSVLNVSNGILDDKALTSWAQIPKSSAISLASEVIQSLDNIATLLVPNKGKHGINVSTQNIDLSVSVLPSVKSRAGQLLSSTNDIRGGYPSSVYVPGSVLGKQNISHDGMRYLSLVTYRTINKVLQSSHGRTGHVQAPVMSVTLKPLNENKFQRPVILTIAKTKTTTNGTPSCAFLDISNSSSISWSTDGCEVGKSNKTHTQCLCYHLTSFAILMQVTDVDTSVLDKEHRIALDLITYIGMCISVFALLVVFLTFTLIRSLNQPRHMIHANLALSLALAHVTFLFGIDKTASKELCKGIAITLHYLFLVAFSWMALEGVVLYLMLVKVFNSSIPTNKTKFIFFVCGWGIPAVVVGASAALYHEGYGAEDFCWLSLRRKFIWAFVAPVLAVIAFNFVCLGFTFYIMAKNCSPKRKADKLRYWVRSCFLLTSVLGVTWLLGVFFVNKQTLLMAYLFNILNGFQGLVIFLLHCVGDKKIRAVYVNILHCHTSSRRITTHKRRTIPRDSSTEQKPSPERCLITQSTSSSLLRSPEVLQHTRQVKEEIEKRPPGDCYC